MVRSVPLRGFDQECAEKIVTYMQSHGTKFIRRCVPISLEKNGNRIRVTYKNVDDGKESEEDFDTVLFAIGRKGEAIKMGLEDIGVKIDKPSEKIFVNEYEQTNIPNIYAIGDIIKRTTGVPAKELTPVAIEAGKLLAKRFFGGTQLMDYDKVPTAVFTPIEYGSCGWSEEEAIRILGKENIEVYHMNYTPLEWELSHRDKNMQFMKLICNKKDSERVVGFHFVGPNAGEITQGVAVAMKLNATINDFINTIGIHPTSAEEMTLMNITKSSGEPAEKSGC
jgi:pyruvate/2-oxoglutarate dehydrogenase complex dihydrolipoamide dehydrogenase (E3) component